MLSIFFIPALQQRNFLKKILFMQYGTSPNTAVPVQHVYGDVYVHAYVLRQTFRIERVISRCFSTECHHGLLILLHVTFAMELPKIESLSRICPRPGCIER